MAAQGVKAQLERVQGNFAEKVALEAKVAVSIAEFVLRRALLDTGRALAAAASSVAPALAAAPPPSPSPEGAATTGEAKAEVAEVAEGETASEKAAAVEAAASARQDAMPFAARVEAIKRTRDESERRSLPAATSAEAEATLLQAVAADEAAAVEAKKQDAQVWAAQAEAQRE